MAFSSSTRQALLTSSQALFEIQTNDFWPHADDIKLKFSNLMRCRLHTHNEIFVRRFVSRVVMALMTLGHYCAWHS